MTNNQYPIYRVINLDVDVMFKTPNIYEVITYALSLEKLSSMLVLKEDSRGHRQIKMEGTSFDALEMCLLESIM